MAIYMAPSQFTPPQPSSDAMRGHWKRGRRVFSYHSITCVCSECLHEDDVLCSYTEINSFHLMVTASVEFDSEEGV